MKISNGIVLGEDFSLKQTDIQIMGEKISQIGNEINDDLVIDADGMYVLPGFIDIHIHGAFGMRANDNPEDLYKITQYESTQGVTAIAITTASSKFDKTLLNLEAAVKVSKKNCGAKIAGIHAEGPFLSYARKGAMNPENILLPDIKKLDKMIEKSEGLLKIITIAPEVDGAIEFIKYASSKGIVISLGHSDATFEQTQLAFKAGATQATHTFNAMRPLNHREPGIIGAVLTNPNICCEMICDYVHLHPATIKLIYDIKGADSINIISDSGHAAGSNLTEFIVDGIKRYVKDGVVRLEDGTIAGSAMSILSGVQNLLRAGYPIKDVSKMVSYNPAKTLKIDDTTGRIKEGNYADLVILDKDYNVAYTFVNGDCVYKRQ